MWVGVKPHSRDRLGLCDFPYLPYLPYPTYLTYPIRLAHATSRAILPGACRASISSPSVKPSRI